MKVSHSRKLADRLAFLGTETAYSVSQEAAALASQDPDKPVFPFHIGDLNFETDTHVIEAMNEAIKERKTGYCPQQGILPLREAIAARVGADRGISYTADNVSVQPGGKFVIAKFLSAVMDPGDEVLYPSPGYPIYSSQIAFLGGVPVPYGFKPDPTGAIRLDLDGLRASVTPATRVLIVNDFHNPTGYVLTPAERSAIRDIAVHHDLWVLADEAYWDLIWEAEGGACCGEAGGDTAAPGTDWRARRVSLASLPGMAERTVILITCSKSWSMTGWRCGAAVGPRVVIDHIHRLNVNYEGCTTTFVQWAAITCFADPGGASTRYINTLRTALLRRRARVLELLADIPCMACAPPGATFYVYVECGAAFELLGVRTYEAFRRRILVDVRVSFTTREHFGRPLPREGAKYIRLAYSGIGEEAIAVALRALRRYIMRSVCVCCCRYTPVHSTAVQGGCGSLSFRRFLRTCPGPHTVLLCSGTDSRTGNHSGTRGHGPRHTLTLRLCCWTPSPAPHAGGRLRAPVWMVSCVPRAGTGPNGPRPLPVTRTPWWWGTTPPSPPTVSLRMRRHSCPVWLSLRTPGVSRPAPGTPPATPSQRTH